MANETRIIISAETARAESAMRTLGQSVDGVTRNFFNLSSVAGTLVGALSITAFAGFIKSSIDAQDNLLKLSKIAGITVEEMSGLKFAAEQNSTDLETVARAANHLGKEMVDKPELFKKFGITATSSTGALVQLADIFAAMPDGIEKTALAGKLMGEKLGPGMVELLSQGSRALQEQIEKGEKLSSVTEESAKQAKLFNDQLNELKAKSSGAGMAIANDLLPSMNSLLDAWLKFGEAGAGGKKANITWLDDFVRNAAISFAKVEIQFEEFASRITWGGVAERHRNAAAQAAKDMQRMLGEQAMSGYRSFVDFAPDKKPLPSGKGRALLNAMGGDGSENKEQDIALRNWLWQVDDLYRAQKDFEKAWERSKEDKRRLIEDAQKEFEALANQGRLLSAGGREEDQYQGQLDALAAYQQQAGDGFLEYTSIREQLEREHQDRMREIAINGGLSQAQADQLSNRQRFDIAAGWMQKTIGSAAQHSRALFNMNKAVALAQAAIALPETVMDAYKWGTKFGGPIGGSVAAGIALAAQLVNVNAIRAAEFGGGMGTAAAGGGSIGAGALPGQATNSSAPAPAAPANRVAVTINLGSDAALLPVTAVRSLIDQINEQIRDGATIEYLRVT